MKPARESAKPAAGPWRCPKCSREFARYTAYHSCGNYTVEGHLAGKNPAGVALFNNLLAMIQKLGDVQISPAKTQIGFKAGPTFMAVAVSGRQLHGYLFLPRAASAPVFRKVVAASARRHIHHFKITDAAMLSGVFAECLAEAFAFAGGNETPTKGDTASSAAAVEPAIGEQINALYRKNRALASGPLLYS
jgi:hypothetical protein